MTATLIYDGECPLCRNAIAWVKRHAREGALEYLACQSPERAERFPSISEARCMEAFLLVMPDGTAHSGHAALPGLFSSLRGWHWVARIFQLPGASLLGPVAYRIIAKNRHVFSVLVAKKHTKSNSGAGRDSSPS